MLHKKGCQNFNNYSTYQLSEKENSEESWIRLGRMHTLGICKRKHLHFRDTKRLYMGF